MEQVVRKHSGRGRSRKNRKKKRTFYVKLLKWAKSNPVKVVAILCGVVLLYITFLFIKEGISNPRKAYHSWETPATK